MSEQERLDRHSGVTHSESGQGHGDDGAPHNSDDEPMVYETPRDYATSARQERARLIAEGADPDSVILQSEVRNHIQRQEGESPADFTKRYVATTKDMINSGVSILNDQCTADVVASGFRTPDGRFFDLGPGSGATKGEFREFSQWFSEMAEAGQLHEVPERWLKFEKRDKGRVDL
ncbi:hypothetical protein PVAR5_1072 [Paecilomyces variotii No. 5]|uniref:Uncharacterized protein n=1 Tax=Byssochlamys spectabilis (strain No. 5 / NBRC 109023) TaxID=1356009 RepID=V5HSR0_BYSSN|nr:hypothetical protein PVAR5_1072 [Paecilomyces variotii No. 5]